MDNFKDLANDTKVNSKKTFTVILNSNNGTGVSNVKQYSFDWSILPNIPYNLYFSFVSGEDPYTTPNYTPILININFGVPECNYITNSSVNANTSFNLGFAKKIMSSTTYFYLSADKNTNPPIYLEGRPTNSIFNVNFITTTGAGWTPTAPFATYYLTLYFEPA